MSRVCIIVPTYDRPHKLRNCLTAIAALEGGPYRTNVVDDGSPTPIAPIVAEFGDWATCIRQDNAGPGAARNTGARAAERADTLLFTDDDCAPRIDWVGRMVHAQDGVPMRLVGGRVDNALTSNPYSSASQALSSFLYEYYQGQGSEMNFFTTNNMCCRREDFMAQGGFGLDFMTAGAEDRDFSLRWKDAGGELRYSSEAVVDHAHVLSFAQFWCQHANYGRGARTLHLAMDRRGDSRPKIEPFRFYAGMLLWPLRHPGDWRIYQSMLVGLSQLAMVAGYFETVREERRTRRSSAGK